MYIYKTKAYCNACGIELRDKLKLSQTAFAIKLGVNQVTVNRWENDKRKPKLVHIKKMERLKRKNGSLDA